LPSVPLAMMMTARGISGWRRRISSQMSSRTFRIWLAAGELLPFADPLPVRARLPVNPDHVPPAVPVRVPWSRSYRRRRSGSMSVS
jgi:hypothetical protein